MIRWGLVVFIVVVVGFTLRPMFTKRFRIPEGVEETRMFLLEDRTNVRFTLPARTSFVELHVVSEVAMEPKYDPTEGHPFGLEAVLTSTGGAILAEWEIDGSSRVSLEHFPVESDDRRGARLAGSRAWVTDNRTITLPVSNYLASQDGLLLVRAKPRNTLYVRGFGVRGTRNRLAVIGARGRDYELRKVILSKYRRRGGDAAPSVRERPLRVRAGDTVAINVSGMADFWLASDQDCSLRVTDGIHHGAVGENLPLKLSRGIESLIGLADLEARTLALTADNDCAFRVLTNQDGVGALIGGRVQPTRDGRYAVHPDVRSAEWIALDPNVPVVTRVEHGESELHLMLRRAGGDESTERRAEVGAEYRVIRANGSAVSRHVEVSRPWSRYESMDGGRISSSHQVNIHLPADALRVEVRGARSTFVRFSVRTGLENEFEFPYDGALPEGRDWYAAPKRMHAWASIEPDAVESLAHAQRLRTVRYQPRIVGVGLSSEGDGERTKSRRRRGDRAGDGKRAVETVPILLAPEGNAFAHRVFVRVEQGASRDQRAKAWTRVPAAGAEVTVPKATGGWLRVAWRTNKESLGRAARVLVDDVEVRSVKAATLSEEVRVRTSPGVHRVRVDGLAAETEVLVDVPAKSGGRGYLLRHAYEVDRGESLSFRIPTEQSAARLLVWQVFTENAEQSWVMPVNVFGNEGAERTPHLLETGSVQGFGSRKKGSMLWDVVDGLRSGYDDARQKLRQPDAPTMRTVTIRLAGGTANRVWVRPVLMGHAEESVEDHWVVSRRKVKP